MHATSKRGESKRIRPVFLCADSNSRLRSGCMKPLYLSQAAFIGADLPPLLPAARDGSLVAKVCLFAPLFPLSALSLFCVILNANRLELRPILLGLACLPELHRYLMK